ncbi:Zinc finger CCHC-type [Trinorchestia longiramus]|nr:Zinc finger CCHC-type [Trinorchestia longiramus]
MNRQGEKGDHRCRKEGAKSVQTGLGDEQKWGIEVKRATVKGILDKKDAIEAFINAGLPSKRIKLTQAQDPKLGEWVLMWLKHAGQNLPVGGYLIKEKMQLWGVIKGIHPSVEVEDIKASADCGNGEFLSVTRLPRAPHHCYRCQRLGHVAVNCNLPLRGLVCSGPHTKDECTAKPEKKKCANLYQTHIASSKECPAFRNAVAIQKLQRFGVGFETAKHKSGGSYLWSDAEALPSTASSSLLYNSVVQGLDDLPSTRQHFQLSFVQERTPSNNITQPAKKPSPQMTTATECADI